MNEDVAEALRNEPEVRIDRAVIQREQSSDGFPDSDAFLAMEEPLKRLTGATVLFTDLTIASYKGPSPAVMGLTFLAEAMNREAIRLFRLFHGHPPRYEEY